MTDSAVVYVLLCNPIITTIQSLPGNRGASMSFRLGAAALAACISIALSSAHAGIDAVRHDLRHGLAAGCVMEVVTLPNQTCVR